MGKEALLVMDVQKGIVDRFKDSMGSLLENISAALETARKNEIIPIFIRVAFRGDGSEISPKNKTFSALASGYKADSEIVQIDPRCGYKDGDILINKKRVSAFAGSDLDLVLRSLDVDSLILSGIATSGVVLSTLRQAADLDFKLTVLRDCCADADAEVHDVLLNKVFPRQSEVITHKEFVEKY